MRDKEKYEVNEEEYKGVNEEEESKSVVVRNEENIKVNKDRDERVNEKSGRETTDHRDKENDEVNEEEFLRDDVDCTHGGEEEIRNEDDVKGEENKEEGDEQEDIDDEPKEEDVDGSDEDNVDDNDDGNYEKEMSRDIGHGNVFEYFTDIEFDLGDMDLILEGFHSDNESELPGTDEKFYDEANPRSRLSKGHTKVTLLFLMKVVT